MTNHNSQCRADSVRVPRQFSGTDGAALGILENTMAASDYIPDPKDQPPVSEGADRLTIPAIVGTALLVGWGLVMLVVIFMEGK